MDFDEFKRWLQQVEPENRGVDTTMRLVAQLVLNSQMDKTLVHQAQQIVGGR